MAVDKNTEPSFYCVMKADTVRTLYRSIQALAKIGENMMLEQSECGLSLKAVNPSQTTFSSFLFVADYLVECHKGELTCNIPMKAALLAIRNGHSLEKNVETCTIRVEADRLVMKFECKFDITKTFRLNLLDTTEVIVVDYDKTAYNNCISVPIRLMADIVSSFGNNQDEISLEAKTNQVVISNYVGLESEPQKVLQTEMSINRSEFDFYRVEEPSRLVFCLKDLKAAHVLGESINVPVSILFKTAGQPIICTLEDSTFCADFVIATIRNQSRSSTAQSQETNYDQLHMFTPTASQQIVRNQINVRSAAREDVESVPISDSSQSLDDARPVRGNAPRPQLSKVSMATVAVSRPKTFPSQIHRDNVFRNANQNVAKLDNIPSTDAPKASGGAENAVCDPPESDQDVDLVPGSPPVEKKTKFRSLFFGNIPSQSSQSSKPESQRSSGSVDDRHSKSHGAAERIPVVLVPDSDSD